MHKVELKQVEKTLRKLPDFVVRKLQKWALQVEDIGLPEVRKRTNMNTKIKYGSKELERDFGSLTFGKALEAHRIAEEFSVKDFAKLLKISSQSLCDLEKGRRVPSPERAAKIATKLKKPTTFWIKLALQDLLRNQKINLTVELLENKKAS